MNKQLGGTEAAVDWRVIHEHLAKASTGTQELSPNRVRTLLEERAQALAQVPDTSQPSGRVLKLVSFTVAREHYALEAHYAREVIRCVDLIPVPGAPDFFLGVMILRGELLDAIHFGKFFGLPQPEMTDPSRLLVVGRESCELGIGVDDVMEILELRMEDLSAPPERGTGMTRKYLRGITKDALVVLDGAALLEDTVTEE
jgi:purine-binding chemotaxis protein CheW